MRSLAVSRLETRDVPAQIAAPQGAAVPYFGPRMTIGTHTVPFLHRPPDRRNARPASERLVGRRARGARGRRSDVCDWCGGAPPQPVIYTCQRHKSQTEQTDVSPCAPPGRGRARAQQARAHAGWCERRAKASSRAFRPEHLIAIGARRTPESSIEDEQMGN
jgi:hypothetical protein